MRLDAIICA